MNAPIIWYFADPMCSWCWGFSPVVDRLRDKFSDRVKFALVLGGLRPFTREPVSKESRQEILHHWQEVHKLTGQAFTFDGAMPEGFIYDTEPASRAVIAVAELLPEATFDYFKAVQRAFYVQQQDVTQVAVLSAILSALLQASPQSIGLDTQQFLQQFRSDKCRQITQAHFQKSRHFGVRGFPSMILQTGSRAEGISQEAASQMETSQTQTPQTQYNLLTSGYRSYAELAVEIDASLL